MAKNRQEADEDMTGGGEPGRKKRKRRLTPFGRFLDILGTLIMLVALLACLGLTVPRFVGIQSYVVVTGSMEPSIPVGSLVYAKPVEPETLQVGDVIRLDSNVDDELSIYVGNIKKFTALPGTSKDRNAVRVVSVIREEE